MFLLILLIFCLKLPAGNLERASSDAMDQEGDHRTAKRRARVADHRARHPDRKTELDRQLGQPIQTGVREHDPDDHLGVRVAPRSRLGMA